MNLRPYPVYKDSGVPWLGTVPQHWKVTRLKNVCRFSYGEPLPADARRDGNVPVFGSNGRVGYHASANSLGPCIIIGRKGSFGKVTYSAEPGFAIDTTFLVDARHSTHNLRLLYYLLGWLRLDQVSRDSAVPGLDRTDAYQRPCSLTVDPNEQAAIVRYLDYMDRRIRRYIRAKRRLIALLNEQKQATIQRAVTRGLDPAVRLKPSGVEWLGDVPEHWEVVPLSATAESIQTGPFGSQLHSGDYVTGGTPVVNPSHLVGGCILPDPRVTVDSVTSERLGRHRLHEGDIVMPRRGELGRCAAVTRDQEGWLCGTGSIRVRPKASVFAPDYLVQLLSSQTMRYALKMYSIGTTMDNLSAGIVARLRLPCPPLEEQNRIVHSTRSVVAAISSTIVLAQRQIDLLRAYRTRLIADVVTGKLDVREAAAHLPDEVDEQEPPDEEEVLDSAGDDMDVVDIMEDAEEFVA